MRLPRRLQLNAPVLRTVMPDFAAGLAWSARTGDLFGAQRQDHFQRLHSDFMDNAIDHLAGALDHVDDGSRIWPLALQNCSMTAADSLAARVTI